MGNDPKVEIVAKRRSELTDRVAKEVIRNFAQYNAGPYMKLVGIEDPHWDGYRHLRLNPFKEDMVEAEVYGKGRIPKKLLDIDFNRTPQIMGNMRYASVHVYTDVDPTDEPSISRKFPYTVASILLDPVADDVEGIAKVACGPPLELIKLDDLKLTPAQQNEFRVVPFWEGPAYVGFNHFKYDEFRKLGLEGLTKAFLHANSHGR